MLTLILPFSLDALQGALRGYLARPAVDIETIVPERVGSGARGNPVYRLRVTYRSERGATDTLNLVLKKGIGWADGSMPGSARREAAFYRTLARHLPIKTPRMLLSADDIVGEPTRPLVVHSSGTLGVEAGGSCGPTQHGEWILMEALPTEVLWPRASWTAEHYMAALDALADLHAAWWGNPPSQADYPWVWTPAGAHTTSLLEESRAALLEIERTSWGGKFLSRERLRAWLRVLDDPAVLLDPLTEMPQTLIHGDYWPGNIAVRPDGPAVFDWQLVGVGPAPYDLACFHSLSRWRFGRVPLSLAEMRNHYLARLNERLGHDERVDRYALDLGVDASRAWRFAILWPPAIVEHRIALAGTMRQLQNAVIEPACASLRRLAA
jgi:hypothetical protein